ncbi:MAG TPA: hypothetical protein VM452_09365 [Caulifigura sp.]|nr:hypothetical protein [Caulifigura sp.]
MPTSRRGVFSLAALLIGGGLLTGCTRQEYPGAKRYAISGKVTCNGIPIDAGVISFRPNDEKVGRLSGGDIVNGVYTVEEPKGPTAGEYRVEILWHKATGKQYPDPTGSGLMYDIRVQVLPPKFHSNSTTVVQVGDPKASFDFNLEVPEAEIERTLKSQAKAVGTPGDR